MKEKRFHYDSALEKVYDYNKPIAGTFESLGTFECCDLLNELNDENIELKKLVNYFKNDCIVIEKSETYDERNDNNCNDCIYYNIEYEEIIAFGEYETLTKSSCNAGHDYDMDELGYYAKECPDYLYNDRW